VRATLPGIGGLSGSRLRGSLTYRADEA